MEVFCYFTFNFNEVWY